MKSFSMAVHDPLHYNGSQQSKRSTALLQPAFNPSFSSTSRDTSLILPARRVKPDGIAPCSIQDKMSNSSALRRVVPDIKLEPCDSQRSSEDRGLLRNENNSSLVQTPTLPQRLHSSKNAVVVCDVHHHTQRPASTTPRPTTRDEPEDDIWVRCNGQLGPPLPPRAPILRRSVSLTHRPPPPPSRSSTVDTLANNSINPVIRATPTPTSVMLPSRSMHQTFWTRSAPLLMDQVVPMSRWPLRDRPSHVVLGTTRSPNVMPLMRWPLPDSSGRLVMDSMGKGPHGGSGNEYVEGPVGDKRGSGRKSTATPSPLLRSSFPQLSATVGLNTMNGAPTVEESVKKKRCSIMNKLARWCGRTKRGTGAGGGGGGGGGRLQGAKEARSVKCHCTNCSGACERTEDDCEGAVNILSCMCCIQPLFYHCLKDDGGAEVDCSDEPCAGCSRPHCALRWAIMALFLPCLPCLCLYVPLRYVLRSNSCRIKVLGCGCDSESKANDLNCARGTANEGVLNEDAPGDDTQLDALQEADPWHRNT